MMAEEDQKIERTVTQTVSEDEMAVEAPLEYHDDLNPKGTTGLRRRRLVIVLAFIAFLLVLAVVLTVAFVLVKNKNSSGTDISSGKERAVPTASPTHTPMAVFSPTIAPSVSPTPLPTPRPTLLPTTLSTADPKENLKRFVKQVVESVVIDSSTLNDPTSPQYLAREWLMTLDNSIWASTENTQLMVERYAMTVLDIALAGELAVRTPTLTVCDWIGVECVEMSEERMDGVSTRAHIRQINWARRGLTGSLPEEIVLVQEYLWKIDLAENDLVGPLPDTFYSLTNLTHVYLHNNRLSGGISDRIANMPQLVDVYFGHNELTGSIPSTWASIRQGEFSKPLRKF